MKILCLYNNDCALELFTWLEKQGHEIIYCIERLDENWCRKQKFELTVSYTYRYILPNNILLGLNNNVVNIHNSFLPWNRGADPNIWSLIDETPRGVTLHYMDEKLDKGNIIAQQLIVDGEDETLKSSYDNLDKAAKELFKNAFAYYNSWQSMKKTANGKGSYHSLKDGIIIKKMIDTYEMKVIDLKEKYRKVKNNVGGGITPYKIYTEKEVA